MKTDTDYDRGYREGLEEGKADLEAISEHLRESREEAYAKGAELAKLRAENERLRERAKSFPDDRVNDTVMLPRIEEEL